MATVASTWDLLPPSSRRPSRITRKSLVLLVVAALAASGIVFWYRSHHGTGDPGGAVMNQLTPAVHALPGYGTPKLPWVASIPQSLTTSYIIRMEPHQESCDGMPSTIGWSPVVVQAGFQYTGVPSALFALLSTRLARLGWASPARPPGSPPQNPPGDTWFRRLDNGSRASASLTEGPGTWSFVVQAPPAGKAASGC